MDEKITICIPSFNEGNQLGPLFESLSKSDLQDFDYEVFLCDSNSQDVTDQVYDKWSRKLNIQLIKTDKANASQNLNAGLEKASGNIYCRIDARARVSKDYFFSGLHLLEDLKETICAVGPLVSIRPQSNNLISKYISSFFLSPFFMGPSRYKKSFFNRNFKGEVDSIYLGFFRTEDLLSIGGFNTELDRKQDIELFNRLRKFTNKGLFISNELEAEYILKHDSVYKIAKRSYIQGFFAGFNITNIRKAHAIPFLALAFFTIIIILSPNIGLICFSTYTFLCGFFGVMEKRNFLSIPLAIFSFFLVHAAYTIGNVTGLGSALMSRISLKF